MSGEISSGRAEKFRGRVGHQAKLCGETIPVLYKQKLPFPVRVILHAQHMKRQRMSGFSVLTCACACGERRASRTLVNNTKPLYTSHEMTCSPPADFIPCSLTQAP